MLIFKLISRKFFYCFSLAILLSLFPILEKVSYAAGGMSGGGGGNGVACFDNELEAKKALGPEDEIRPDALSKIRSFETLDVWEMPANVNFFNPKKDETAVLFLKRILQDYWQKFSPEFVAQIMDTLEKFEKIPVTSNEETIHESVHAIYDTGNIERQIPSNCHLVGVINRFEFSQKGEFPKIDVRLNLQAFNLLGGPDVSLQVLNQAAMILHETIYILAAARGDSNSHDARLATRLLLSKTDFDRVNSSPENDSIAMAEEWLNIGSSTPKNSENLKATVFYHLLTQLRLDQFLGLFEKDGVAGVHTTQYTKKSRVQSWKSIHLKAELCNEQWTKKFNPERQALNSIGFISQANYRFQVCSEFALTDEEAFLLMGQASFESGQISNPYVFFNTQVDDHKEFQTVCDGLAVKNTQDLSSRSLHYLEEAKRYCLQLSPL